MYTDLWGLAPDDPPKGANPDLYEKNTPNDVPKGADPGAYEYVKSDSEGQYGNGGKIGPASEGSTYPSKKDQNKVGKKLMSWTDDLSTYKTNFSDFNCSPTTFNRTDKATEAVYGKDILGTLSYSSNPIYRLWMKSGKNSLPADMQQYFNLGPVGAALYLGLGYQVSVVDAMNGKLKYGALLNLKDSYGGGHSVFFMNYRYENGKIVGFDYWETNDSGSSNFSDSDDWQIRKALNFY
jgi:hypothetical protein